MRWEERLLDLFEDLEQQAEGLALAERDAGVGELARAAYAEVTLTARLHASRGLPVTLALAGVGQVVGRVLRVGADWLLLETATGEWIVAVAALTGCRGLSEQATAEPHRGVAARVRLGSALREVADERVTVVVHRRDGSLRRGSCGRVGADFVELAVRDHDEAWPAAGAPVHVEVVPFAAIAAVRRT